MGAKEAIDNLDSKRWAQLDVGKKIEVLKKVRENIGLFGDKLASSDAKMKNKRMGEEIYALGESKVATVVPMASALTAAVDLYEEIKKTGKMPKPLTKEKLGGNTYKVKVFPNTVKEKVMSGTQEAYLYVKGEPKQINPLEKEGGIIAVLGAGNYSSALEMMKALCFDNCVVVHKPHELNSETDKIWEKIFEPLKEIGAVSFCNADDGPRLTKDSRLKKIYFTGGTSTAKMIMENTETPVISECGGNNPCIIVPGKWTPKEIEHQAMQIVTVAKMNGGAVCGRPQTLITSKEWPQREEFLFALKEAILQGTPAAGTYYPNSDRVWNEFKKAHPDAEILQPEKGRFEHGKFMFIEGIDQDSYAIKNEAFCQIINEIPLEDLASPKEFLERAVEFCNKKLYGTLGAAILIDEETKKFNRDTLDKAVEDMHYGGITVNNMPPFIFLSPYLTWGGNEEREGQKFVSGSGHFGNLLGFENIEKSVIYDKFMSPGHFINKNKSVFDDLTMGMSDYSVEPTWKNILKLVKVALTANFKKKDF